MAIMPSLYVRVGTGSEVCLVFPLFHTENAFFFPTVFLYIYIYILKENIGVFKEWPVYGKMEKFGLQTCGIFWALREKN